jgi:Arc/MetJ family transcription regulator
MRTNIVIDDTLIAEAMRLTRIKTKRAVVDMALRTLIRIERQRAVLDLEGRIEWEGDLNQMREARIFAEDAEEYDAGSG